MQCKYVEESDHGITYCASSQFVLGRDAEKIWRHLSHNNLSPDCDLNVTPLNTKLNWYPINYEVLLVVVMLLVVEVRDDVPCCLKLLSLSCDDFY